MEIRLPRLEGPELEAWNLIFELYRAHPTGWAVVGAQMVILHSAAHDVTRPVRTGDTDVLVDIRAINLADISTWLIHKGFDLDDISVDGIGHRFVRGGVKLDLLSIDHTREASRTTVPPARTVEVPGGRQAIGRTVEAHLHIDEVEGLVPVPDWAGAVLLKARAAVSIPEERDKHARDLALLLGLPVDLTKENAKLSTAERRRIREASSLLTDDVWTSVARSIDTRNGRIAMTVLASAPKAG
jgi:predicted nucleotidyltransferase